MKQISAIIRQVFIKLRTLITERSVTMAVTTLGWESGNLGSSPSLVLTNSVVLGKCLNSTNIYGVASADQDDEGNKKVKAI